MRVVEIEKVLEDEHISEEMTRTYSINGWKIILNNNTCKYYSETCTDGYILEDSEQIRDLTRVHKIDDRCVEACTLNGHKFNEETAIKAMEFLNQRDHYAKILRQYDPMKIVEKIEWKIEPEVERQIIYVYYNLEVPIFYEREMNRMMDAYFDALRTECREIGLGPNDFKPLPYDWS